MFYKCILILMCAVCTLSGCTKEAPTDAQLVHSTEQAAAYENLDNTLQAWGMKKNKDAEPNVDAAQAKMLEKYGGLYKTSEKKTLYLTFDEGYETGYTAQILDVLKKTKVPAAFFITGDYLRTQPDLVKRMAAEGHNVGNHTFSHPSMPSVTDPEKLKQDIESLSMEYTALTGKQMNLFRPPMGEFSERTLAITQDLGYKTVMWSFAYVDWQRDKTRGADYAYEQIMPYMHDGAIILLHAVSPDNANALERVICDLQAQGYTFAAL